MEGVERGRYECSPTAYLTRNSPIEGHSREGGGWQVAGMREAVRAAVESSPMGAASEYREYASHKRLLICFLKGHRLLQCPLFTI